MSGPLVPGGATAVYALLGSPVAHTLSPALHNAAFRAVGRDAVYVAFEVSPGRFAAALAGLVAAGLGGVNLTAPHKAAGAHLAAVRTPRAEAAGVANTLAFRDGRTVADNTDGAGFVRFLERAGCPPAGRSVAVFGAGGAVHGLLPALLAAGAAPLTVIARRAPADVPGSFARALRDRLAETPAVRFAAWGSPSAEQAVREAGLVVQGTPLGRAAADPLPCPAEWVDPGATAVDLLYDPPESAWLAALRRRGVRAANGLGLLVEQALLAQVFWFGEEPPRSALEEAVSWRDPFAAPPAGEVFGRGASPGPA